MEEVKEKELDEVSEKSELTLENRKRMAEKTAVASEPTAKHDAKASVFTDLFSDLDRLLQLYQTLHPEDKVTKVSDLTLMTMESHLVNQQYNDLGFMVGNQLLILLEAQSLCYA